jgi:hypothetical protein
MNKITPYLKALVGALIAGLGSLYQAYDDGTITGQEWVAVAIATVAALGIVWGVPNMDPKGTHQDESVQPPDLAGNDHFATE